jgi:uncharacterized repeat protein (TIGR03847 family)
MMPRRIFDFDPPDRFLAGTLGSPGQRAFYLQAAKGGAVVTVSLEKLQVAALAERLAQLLVEVRRRGVELPDRLPAGPADTSLLEEPVVEQFRVGTMALAWDGEDGRVVIEARAQTEEEDDQALEDDDSAEGPDLVRVHVTPGEALTFAERANLLLAAGRPPCPMCGQPLSAEGHLCPRRNGYLN